jgi:hypothetical protein
LAGAKDKLKVRGQSLESLQVQAISDKALKLRVGLPQALKAELARTPSVEASIIQELAAQLKQADKRIVYAHPNWIMGGMPPVARDFSMPSRKQTSSAPSRKQVSSAASRKPTKRIAKRAKAAHVARKRARGKLAARQRCRCWREVAWVLPCRVRPVVARFGRW